MALLYMSLNRAASSTCVQGIIWTSLTIQYHAPQGYHGAAAGKGRQLAKTELEKLKLSELTTREAVFEAARM
jgi:20S proteasome subunit alpha 7